MEKERQTYINAGFDGWILKPIAFNRLSEIMKGIVDGQARKENLYNPGGWEYGGWFDEAQKDVFAADTKPSREPPMNEAAASGPSAGVKAAADSSSPFVKEENSSEQTREQQRLAESQKRQAPKAASMPELSGGHPESSDETLTQETYSSSPPPMTPEPEWQ